MPDFKELSVYLFLLVTVVLISKPVSGSVTHKVSLGEEDARVVSLLTMTSEKEFNKWEITLNISENTIINSVEDSRGKISYIWRDGSLSFETNSGPLRHKERVRINFTRKNVTNIRFEPVETTELNLFGFRNETTKAEIKGENIVTWYTPFGFRSQKEKSTLKFSGKGPLSVFVHRTDKGNSTKHYRYFSNQNISRFEKTFSILPYLTGMQPPKGKFILVFLNSSKYNSFFNEWSSGRYKSGGLIVVRKNLSRREKIPTVMHETMHGFNSEILKWDSTGTTYFDEGMAKFVEFLIKQKLGIPQSEIFGEKVVFVSDGSKYYFKPRSSSDELWKYYNNDETWMRGWNTRDIKNEDVREFGYAYGELMVRKYVEDNSIESLRDLFGDFSDVDREVRSIDEKSKIVSELLGRFKPCHNKDRTEFESCIDEINNQEFNLTGINLNLTPFDRESQSKLNITWENLTFKETSKEKNLIFKIKSFFRFIFGEIEWISKMF